MAQYFFKFNDINIRNLRSANSDTDYASFAVRIGTNSYGPLTKAMGDLHQGIYPVGLSIGPVEVPNDQTPILLGWTVVNSGHTDPSQAIGAVASAAGTIVGTITLGAPFIGPIVGSIVSGLTSVFIKNHDGPCVIQGAAITGAQLNQVDRKDWNPQSENHPGDAGSYDSKVIAYKQSAYPQGI
jgi:hypothetical protein